MAALAVIVACDRCHGVGHSGVTSPQASSIVEGMRARDDWSVTILVGFAMTITPTVLMLVVWLLMVVVCLSLHPSFSPHRLALPPSLPPALPLPLPSAPTLPSYTHKHKHRIQSIFRQPLRVADERGLQVAPQMPRHSRRVRRRRRRRRYQQHARRCRCCRRKRPR